MQIFYQKNDLVILLFQCSNILQYLSQNLSFMIPQDSRNYFGSTLQRSSSSSFGLFPKLHQEADERLNLFHIKQKKYQGQDFQNFKGMIKKVLIYCTAKANKHQFVANARVRQVRKYKSRMLSLLKENVELNELDQLSEASQAMIIEHLRQNQRVKIVLQELRVNFQGKLRTLEQSNIMGKRQKQEQGQKQNQQSKQKKQRQKRNVIENQRIMYMQKQNMNGLVQNFYSMVADFENEVERLDHIDIKFVENIERSFKRLLETGKNRKSSRFNLRNVNRKNKATD